MEDKIYVNSYTILSSSIFQNQPGRHHRLTNLKQKFTQHEIKTYAKQRDHMREGLKKTFHLIWLQFSDTVISQIESISGFKKIQINVNAIGLLIEIKIVQHKYKIDKHPVCALHMAKRVFISRRRNQGLIKHD